MALSRLASIRKNSTSKLQELQKKTKEAAEGKQKKEYAQDERFWQPTADEQGNGSAVIRLLNEPAGEEDPYVTVFFHSFKGPSGMWYIENSRTTIGEDDPVVEANNELWESENKADHEIARTRSRKKHHYCNIYVVKDPGKPENEGKVFLWKMPETILKLCMEKMAPEDETDEPMNPFDVVTGQNLLVKIHKEKGYRRYTKSKWTGTPGPLLEDDEELEAVLNQCHSLAQFHDAKSYKSYDELKKKLDRVLGKATPKKAQREDDEDSIETHEQPVERKPKPVSKKPAADEGLEEEMDELDKILAGK